MNFLNRNGILTFFLSSHPTMSTAQLQEIPNAAITKEVEDSQIQCAVCFEKFNLNESGVRKLPCDHLFHDTCIFPWLQSNASCPICRAQLPNANQNNGKALIRIS